MPNGEAYYQDKVKYHTTLDRSAQEIHKIGKQEVDRIRKQMMEIVRQEGYQNFDSFIKFLRTDEQFYADTEEELMKEYAYVLKQLDGMLLEYFKKLPRTPYGIKKIPEYQGSQSTAAYYMPPPSNGSRPGIFYINTYDLSARPLYEIEALAVHEAVPGHHLQNAIKVEQDALPAFRKHANLYAYSEGWGLYAEWLGKEMGIYDDHYSKFGRLSYEMLRAMRLVVDTGMHALGWSRQKAIDYMLANSAMSELDVKNEVNRYISWPGQALAYKMGELKIQSLRKEAEKELGDDFNVREFHNVILQNGALPLDLLEKEVQEYIHRKEH